MFLTERKLRMLLKEAANLGRILLLIQGTCTVHEAAPFFQPQCLRIQNLLLHIDQLIQILRLQMVPDLRLMRQIPQT